MRLTLLLAAAVLIVSGLSACGAAAPPAPRTGPDVIAVETFLADIAQNVAGDRLTVRALLPVGADPHSYEPTPADVATVSGADLLIVNGAGFEGFLDTLLRNAGGKRTVVEATAGLQSRAPAAGEPSHGSEADPHFWMDPSKVVAYVENIRAALTQVDPDGAQAYAANAQAYTAKLNELDAWIAAQVQQVPPERRLLITNHESFGYFADRYGFRVVGSIIPSVSSSASPSAQQLAALIDAIRKQGAPAIFLETGTNPQLADQLASETHVKVVTGLYTHSTGGPDSNVKSYIDMMRYNTSAIVEALK